MKKGLKILSTSLLLSTLLVAGCSCNKDDAKNVSKIENSGDSVLTGLSDETSNYTLQDVYAALIASNAGNVAVASKLADFISSEVLKINDNESVWKARYETLIAEKLKEAAESDTYLVKGEFSEKFFIENLENDGYKVTCPAGVSYGTTSALACDYSDYVNKTIRLNVLQTLLKEKYIQDVTMKDRNNLLTNKKIRDVEYLSISTIRDRIAEGEVIDFSAIEEEFKTKLEDIVEEEYAKIDTSKDYSNAIAAKYTNNFTQDKSIGRKNKLDEIADAEYSYNKLISSDSESNAVVSDAITSMLLSITDPTKDEFNRKVVPVKDANDNTYYYLVNVNAGTVVDETDVLLSETSDSSTYTYSFVRFRVIDSSTTNEEDVYEAVKLMAKESTLGNNALSHYVKENKDKISVYDDEVKEYLETLYPDVFAE